MLYLFMLKPSLTWLQLIDGKLKTLLVHRKGATRAFPPHHPLIPVDYQVRFMLYTMRYLVSCHKLCCCRCQCRLSIRPSRTLLFIYSRTRTLSTLLSYFSLDCGRYNHFLICFRPSSLSIVVTAIVYLFAFAPIRYLLSSL